MKRRYAGAVCREIWNVEMKRDMKGFICKWLENGVDTLVVWTHTLVVLKSKFAFTLPCVDTISFSGVFRYEWSFRWRSQEAGISTDRHLEWLSFLIRSTIGAKNRRTWTTSVSDISTNWPSLKRYFSEAPYWINLVAHRLIFKYCPKDVQNFKILQNWIFPIAGSSVMHAFCPSSLWSRTKL